MPSKDFKKRIDEHVEALRANVTSGEAGGAPIWMTVYSDMMTNLMLFFLMMFAFNLVEEVHLKNAAKAFQDTIEGRKTTVKEAFKADNKLKEIFANLKAKEENVQVMEEGEGVRLRLPEPVLFDSGQATLKLEASAVLQEIAQGLKGIPNTIVVEGHTDDRPVRKNGPFKSNWELSEARAESVLNHFIRGEGILPHRLAVAGFGEYWPFMPNDSDVNRALNRRIEILVIRDDEEKNPL
jgi:chemotaxis protein MotB